MPDDRIMVMNTGPILALIAAIGDLTLLDELYDRVVVPRCVADEVLAGGAVGFGVEPFRRAGFLDVQESYCRTELFLQRSLDRGEAAVIQTACNLSINRVCIDEAMGRRVSRLYGLSVTGSLGILIKGIKAGKGLHLELCIEKMRQQGVWISDKTARQAQEMVSRP